MRAGWAGPGTTPAGPGRPTRGPPCTRTLRCRLLANKARFHDIFYKVSQNRRVSLKSVEKACHSPYFPKRSQKSPLDFLRFPFCVAFSHKELMGRFDPYSVVYCQNDEVSPDVHTPEQSRERVARYPHGRDSKLSASAAPHLAQRGILIGTVYP